MNRFVLRQSFILLLTAMIWGVAFVAQSAGMDYVGPFTFNAVRCIIGGLVLIPCIFLLNKLKPKENDTQMNENNITEISGRAKNNNGAVNKQLISGGVVCGIILCIASNFQQIGLQYTTVGKAGFITALYIIIVPVFGIFMHRRAGLRVWMGVIMAVIGFYFLCISENLMLQPGDLLELLCAIAFSVHIIVIDYFAGRVDGVKLSCIQFFVCGAICTVLMLVFEEPDMSQILSAWQPVLYAGVMSCGVAYTLQVIGQRGMNPTVASLMLSLESVISALAGWMLLNQSLSSKELFGCILVFAAIVLAQLPKRRTGKVSEKD